MIIVYNSMLMAFKTFGLVRTCFLWTTMQVLGISSEEKVRKHRCSLSLQWLVVKELAAPKKQTPRRINPEHGLSTGAKRCVSFQASYRRPDETYLKNLVEGAYGRWGLNASRCHAQIRNTKADFWPTFWNTLLCEQFPESQVINGSTGWLLFPPINPGWSDPCSLPRTWCHHKDPAGTLSMRVLICCNHELWHICGRLLVVLKSLHLWSN